MTQKAGPAIIFRARLVRGESASAENPLAWQPPVDIYETDDQYVLSAEVPGVDEGNLKIEIARSELRIRGERRFDAVCSEENYHRLEGSRGRFQRTFSLPEPLDHGSVRAMLNDGVLEVILPKARS